MKDGATLFFQASMLLLILSCIVCVDAELDSSENNSVDGFFNPRHYVPSSLSSVFVRHTKKLSCKQHFATKKKMLQRQRNRKRTTNMRRREMAVLAKSTKPTDNDGPSDAGRLSDTIEANQFTFTSPDSRGLVIQVKPFVRPAVRGRGRNRRSTVSYKVYVLEGTNIRHYRVQFPSGRLGRATFSVRQRVANCVRRKYLKRCIDLSLRRKASCTTRIVKKCVPGFTVFEDASTATLGTNRSSPLPSIGVVLNPSPAVTPDVVLDSVTEGEDRPDATANLDDLEPTS